MLFTFVQNIIEDEKWYDLEVSDTTMLTKAASLFGQKNLQEINSTFYNASP